MFTTKDGWKSTTHSASIKADKFGGTPTFTYEMNSRIYYGVIVSLKFDGSGPDRRLFELMISSSLFFNSTLRIKNLNLEELFHKEISLIPSCQHAGNSKDTFKNKKQKKQFILDHTHN